MEMRRGKTQLDKMSKALNSVEGRRGRRRGRGIHLRELTGDYEQRRALTAKVKGGKGKENYAMRQKKKAEGEGNAPIVDSFSSSFFFAILFIYCC